MSGDKLAPTDADQSAAYAIAAQHFMAGWQRDSCQRDIARAIARARREGYEVGQRNQEDAR